MRAAEERGVLLDAPLKCGFDAPFDLLNSRQSAFGREQVLEDSVGQVAENGWISRLRSPPQRLGLDSPEQPRQR